MPHRLPRLLMLAAASVMLCSGAAATAADVQIDIGLGGPPLVLTAPPQLLVVPGTPVYYAPDVAAHLVFYQGRYDTVATGVWSVAPAYGGPWAVIQVGQVPAPAVAVPVEYYTIPPGQLKKPGPPPWAGQGHGKPPKKPKDE